ncbi:LuxR C-terminal-related transcriptional regulator [Scandinavium goeteborgense]|uniref:helix-turn-helix transcriptional regulator n=1 Tax=Scandinavium goeteborgense TaxID=1851514 RepID=UPI00380BE9AA
MLYVKIENNNIYFKNGLCALFIKTINDREIFQPYSSLNLVENDYAFPDITFRDSTASIHLRSGISANVSETPHMIVHTPFICDSDNLHDVMTKIQKMMLISSMTCGELLDEKMLKSIGIKRGMQLSRTEITIMCLFGEGKDQIEIAKILARSVRTVSTHIRNSINKMGMRSRADFYHYATHITKFGPEVEVMNICL